MKLQQIEQAAFIKLEAELHEAQLRAKVSEGAHKQTACQYMQSRQEVKRLHGELSERDHRLYVFVKDLAERTEELAQSKVQLGVSHMARKKADEELTWFKTEVEKAYADYKKLSQAHRIQSDHAFNNGKYTAKLRKQMKAAIACLSDTA